MISEGSCDTEDWNKGITGIHNIFKALYGIVYPKKRKFWNNFLTLKLLQTCMNVFCLLNIKNITRYFEESG